ncbi:hypothetical protein KR215_008069, partial [Drosophila sulfurigaster]
SFQMQRWLLVALAALLMLQLVAAATPAEEDQPTIDFPALFKAYIRLGDALFGDWVPENY